jgi:hypothetical protein
LIFAEIKTDTGKVNDAQEGVLTTLSFLRGGEAPDPRVDVQVWRPQDFDLITEQLREP